MSLPWLDDLDRVVTMASGSRAISFFSAIVPIAVLSSCGGGYSCNCGPSVPTPTPTAALTGTLQVVTGGTTSTGFTYTAASGANVVFSCGCTSQAGTSATDGSGVYTLVQNSPATPAAPNPTYTIVPGRNYIVIGQTASGTQAWTTQFAGKRPSDDLSLSGSNPSDIYASAVSLYVFGNSPNTVLAFDDWNFNSLSAWYGQLKTAPNVQETQLLNDIAVQSVANASLYPGPPGWNSAQPVNHIIAVDLANVKSSADALIPTPCPTAGGVALCTGTPTP